MMTIRGNAKLAILLIAGIAGLAAIAGVVGVQYTSRTSFCAGCHEMEAVHTGWKKGSHAEVHCYDCHVGDSFAAQLRAKAGGLRQLVVHFTSEVNMDNVTTAVPRERCARCHNMSEAEKLGARIVTAHFKHAEATLECTVCHMTSGHSREKFVGFANDSCKECHPRKIESASGPYLKRPPCTRPADEGSKQPGAPPPSPAI